MKISVAGKGGVGKTTISALLAHELAARELRVLAVDCDPNPTLAEELGSSSAALDRFAAAEGLRRAGATLELAREPLLIEVAPRIRLLGGPPSHAPLADAVARGIAGVLLAERFDAVVTDLGAGPELAGIAVGGVLNPADICVALDDGTPRAVATAERVAAVAAAKRVSVVRIRNRRGEQVEVARELADRLAGPGAERGRGVDSKP